MCYVCYISTRDHAERAEKSESNGAHWGRERDAFPFVNALGLYTLNIRTQKNSWSKSRQAALPHICFVPSERETRETRRGIRLRAHTRYTRQRERERYGETRCVVVARFVRVTERVTEIDAFFLSFFLRVTDELIQTRE